MRLWRMGSNPSKSDVVSIRIPSAQQRKRFSDVVNGDKQPGSHTQTKNSAVEVNQLMDELKALRKELSHEKTKSEKEQLVTTSFQEQLDEREREILFLNEELESLQNQHLVSSDKTEEDGRVDNDYEEERMDRTVHAKDQYIKSLEDELAKIKEETTTLNERYQKKLKKVRTLSSKSRQDSSLKLFELKDENSKLVEENTKLQERLERMSMDSGDFSRESSATSRRSVKSRDHDVTEEADPHDDPRMNLILDLSQQVATLDSENNRLKQELKHSKKIAEKVERARLKAKRKSQDSSRHDVMIVDNAADWSAVDSARACVEVGK